MVDVTEKRQSLGPPSDDQLIEWIQSYEKTPPLVVGRNIICPLCETPYDILAYHTLHFVDKYAEHLVPILKCRSCKHVFALRP